MKAKKRMAGVLAACIVMMTAVSGGASAESVTVTADRLYVRSQADAGSKSLGVVRSGDELSFVSENGSWYQVKYNGKTGFVMEDYVDLDLQELEADVAANTEAFAATGVTTDRVNLRELPMTDSSIVKVAPKKGEIEIIGKCGDWYQARYAGKTGYLMAQYVTLTAEATAAPGATIVPEATIAPEATVVPEATAAPVQPEEPTETIYDVSVAGVTNARVNMRAGASTKDKIMKVLGKGAEVSILGEYGEWYKVSAGGKEGYMIKECVEQVRQDASAPEEIIYAEAVVGEATVRVNMRKTPSTGAKIVKVIGIGQNVTIEGEYGGWYKVTSGGKEGYISKSYLTIKKDADGEAEVPDGFVSYPAARTGTVNVRVNMRKSASTSAGIEKVLAAGTQVTVTGEQSGFYQVTCSGKSGYIAKAYVTLGVSEETPDTDNADGETIYSEAKSGVTTVTVNLRAVPEGEVLHTLSANTLVTLVGENGSWYKVRYGDESGYIAKAYVDEKESAADTSGEGTKAYITAKSVNMRRGPGTNYGVIKVLKSGAEIQYYALSDGWYLIKAGEDTGYVSADYVSEANPGGSADEDSGKVLLSDWFTGEIQSVLERGDVATITDVKTGLKFQFKRTGGYYHADAQPLTRDDTAIMFKIYDSKWKWDRRAIWVTVDGKTYAASMNGMPHGETDSMPDNGFDGCFCIHFLNSKTHEGNRVDSAHQTCVKEAYAAGN